MRLQTFVTIDTGHHDVQENTGVFLLIGFDNRFFARLQQSRHQTEMGTV